MKLAAKQFDTFLARPGEVRALLLYGPDSGAARERMGMAIKRFLGDAYDPLAVTDLEEPRLLEEPSRLSDECASFSLLGPTRRVIVIRSGGDKLSGLIESAMPQFHPDVFIIVLAGELGPRSALRALFEKEPSLAALACYADESRDVADLVRNSFREAGVEIERPLVEYLASQLGSDRGVTRQEIQKLLTYAGGKPITLDEAQLLVDYNRDTELDDVAQALADRKLPVLDHAVRRLTREGIASVAYVRAALRYFNRLYVLRAQVDAGRSASEVVAGARPPIFFKQIPAVTKHLEYWSTARLAKALALLGEAELAAKSSDLPHSAPTRLMMQVTQVR